MYYYSFEASVFYIDDNELKRETGIVAGKNYKEAVNSLLEYYGEEGLEEFKIALLSDCPLIVDKKDIKKIAAKVIW